MRFVSRIAGLGPALSTLVVAACAAKAPPASSPPAPAAAPVPTSALAPENDPLRSPARDIEEEGWSPIQSDFPFQASVVTAPFPKGNTANKSIAIRLGDRAAMNFDTDLLRVAAGWTGAFLTATGVTFDTSHGGHPQVAGEQRFGTAPGPGWADARGRFDDPRDIPFGPLPAAWARWDGLYVLGDDIVLAYTVHGTKVNEQPSALERAGVTTFVRTFALGPSRKPLRLLVADVGESATIMGGDGASPDNALVASADERSTAIAAAPLPRGATFTSLPGGRIVLDLPASPKPQSFRVLVAAQPGRQDKVALAAPLGEPRIADIRAGGRRHWPNPIVTRGVRADGPGPYVVDRITTPFPGVYRGQPKDWGDNVFHRRIMIGGFDFFSDGKRAAVSTWEGDVWIVTGIDDDLDRIEWHRFASGLFEPLGLRIVDDVVYVNGRDQITRLFDSNGDGEADLYENFNNQVTNSPGFHEFQFDLQTDKQGNFYTAKAGPVRGGGRGFGGGGGNGEITPFAGAMHKISKDGKRREIYATGFRAPNGIGVSPTGQVTTGDNEGTWMPTSPINWVKKGGFYGVEPLAHKKKIPPHDPPLCWIGKSYDNSGGAQVWVTSDKWGPLQGEMLHLSYGRASIYLVMKEKVQGLMQGGIVRMLGGEDAAQFTGTPVKLTSSAMRARFNPVDGQLYVAGLAGWQTDAVSLTGFDRIRYTGADVVSVRDLRVTSAGVHLTFSHKLDPASVDPQNFSGERWNYRRTESYGSPEFSVEDPSRRGHDRLDIFDTYLSKDGKTVTLQLGDLRPVHQMLLKFSVKTVDGQAIKQSVMHTIHRVPRDPKAQKMNLRARRGKPGLALLLAQADATADAIADARVEAGVSLYVGRDHGPTPLLADGPWKAQWKGSLTPELKGQYLLAADVAGALTVKLGGKTVLAHTGAQPARITSAPIDLDKAPNPLDIELSSTGGDTHLRLEWARNPDAQEAELGVKALYEPIPTSAFRHEPDARMAAVEERRLGRTLFLESRCGNCHVDENTRSRARTPEMQLNGPDLAGIGSRRNWSWMQRWVRDPRNMRAGARMPQMFTGPDADKDTTAVAAYLATLRDPKFEAVRDANAESVDDALQRLDNRTGDAHATGDLTETFLCQGCHVAQANAADDGRESLNAVGFRFKKGALTEFLLAPERDYPFIAMPNFRFSKAEAVQLEALLLSRSWKPPVPEPPSDPAVIARGKELVATTGCLHCHKLDLPNRSPALALVGKTTSGDGCIEGKGPATYRLIEKEKRALEAFIAAGLPGLDRHAPTEFAERQVRALGCENCHGRFDGFPALDIVGEKLRPEWMAAFIAGRVPYKPRGLIHPDGHEWLPARMPAFPARAVLLAEGLAARAGFGPRTPAEPPIDAKLAKEGARLVSANGGFSCIGCHGSGTSPATQVFEAEGINFAYVAFRLRPDFFRRWLQNPMKIDPQTKMPSYFDASGSSPLDDVLEGRADRQIEAMWQHMRQLAHEAPANVARR